MEKLITWIIGIVVVFLLYDMIFGENKRRNNATKRCSSCGMQIPMKATICPYCRRKPGFDFKAEYKVSTSAKVTTWFLILLIVVTIIAGLFFK